ncbi:MAG TPA: DRTGG domain-containing protein [Chloroflexota bacterium]
MLALCLCSTDSGAGKTSLAVALGRRLRRDHLQVEYVQTVTSVEFGDDGSSSVEFVRRVLGLAPSTDQTFPVSISGALEELEGDVNYAPKLARHAASLGSQCDVLLVETGDTVVDGSLVGLGVPDVAAALQAPTIILARFTGESVVDAIMAARLTMGSRLIGAVVTGVPITHKEFAQHVLRPALERRGVRVLGMLPADVLLSAVTVGELVTRLEGTFLCCEEAADELVERLMVGAMNAEHAASYFRRQANKAVITGGDRPNIQLAALETPTRCLILTGPFPADAEVLSRAKALGVPVVTVPLDTLTAVERSQEVFAHTRYRQEKKIARFEELFNRHFDVATLYSALGLRPGDRQAT